MNNTSNGEYGKQKEEVHEVLAYSYLVYFAALISGLLLDIFFPVKIIPQSINSTLGVFFLIFGPILIFWAQRTSRKMSLEKKDGGNQTDFFRGPYVFTRSPTHVGLNLLVIGFGFILNSIFLILFSIISFFITRAVFLKKEEAMLSEKYGAGYESYKKSVRNWI